MQISFRELMTEFHGMGFGALFLLAFSGLLIELFRTCSPEKSTILSVRDRTFVHGYLICMVVLAWGAVLSGAYIVYPWYRAHPPLGTTDLSEYSQRSLLANPMTAGWHNLGMEWKEHVAWFAPIAITMVAYIFIRYGSELAKHKPVRQAVFAFSVAAFFAASIAGTFGALINKHAPILGGTVITVMGAAK